MGVGENLDLDMPRRTQKFLHVDDIVVKRGCCFGACQLYRIQQVTLGVHHAHAASAATAGRLDDDGVTNLAPHGEISFLIIVEGTIRTRHRGHPGLFHGLDRGDLVAHGADRIRARSDKLEAAGLDLFGKLRVFREKAVSGVNAIGVGEFGGAD